VTTVPAAVVAHWTPLIGVLRTLLGQGKLVLDEMRGRDGDVAGKYAKG